MPSSYKNKDLTMSDTARDRMAAMVKARTDKREQARQEKEQQDSLSFKEKSSQRWEKFKAFITNKEVKTAIKNTGKEFKAWTDATSKTFDTTSSTAKSVGQGGVIVGGVTQLVETVVDVYLVKQKVDKAKRDLETVEKGDLQVAKEKVLENEVAELIGKENAAKKTHSFAQSSEASCNLQLQTRRSELVEKEKEVASLKDKLAFVEEQMKPGPGVRQTRGTDFLEEQQKSITGQLDNARTTLTQIGQNKDVEIGLQQAELNKLEGQLRMLDENIEQFQQEGRGTDFLTLQREKVALKIDSTEEAISGLEQDKAQLLQKQQEVIKRLETRLRSVEENLEPVSQGLVLGAKFLTEERDRLTTELSRAQGEVQDLQTKIGNLEKSSVRLNKRVTEKKSELDDISSKLGEKRKELGESLSKDKLKTRMAEKDLNTYNDSVPLERAKLMKSLLDGANGVAGITNVGIALGGASTVVVEGAKLSGGMIGIIAGPVTAGVNAKDMVDDIRGNRAALNLKHKASDALKSGGIKQDDAELLAIAERLRLKQKKQSVDKGLSATKNAFGALGGIGTAASGAAAIAVVVGGTAAAAATAAAILTPVGWALAGAAAAAALGYGVYKLARHINSTMIKNALKNTLEIVGEQMEKDPNRKLGDLKAELKNKVENGTSEEKKQAKKELTALDRVAKKASKALGVEKDDLTMEQLQNYSSKKLLSRDTGTATKVLHTRFKEEVGAYLNGREPTKELMEQYIKTERLKPQADSALGLLSKLGVGMKPEEALDLYRNKNEADGLKFLTRKVYSAHKEEDIDLSQQQGVKGVQPEKDKQRVDQVDSLGESSSSVQVGVDPPKDGIAKVEGLRDSTGIQRKDSSSSLVLEEDDSLGQKQEGPQRDRRPSVRDSLHLPKPKSPSSKDLSEEESLGESQNKGKSTRDSFKRVEKTGDSNTKVKVNV